MSTTTPAADPVTVILTGQLPFVLITSAVLAFLISLVCLAVYKRAVVKSMRRSFNSSAPQPQRQIPRSCDSPTGGTLNIKISQGSSQPSSHRTSALFAQARHRPWQAALVFGVSGVAFAVVMTTAFFVSSRIEPNWLNVMAIGVSYLWPAAITTNMVAAQTRRTKVAIVLLYFVVFASINAISLARSPDLTLGQVVLYWSVYNVPPSLLLLLFLNRRIRAVGPLVLIFTIVGLTGATLATSLASSSERTLRIISEIGFALGLGATGVLIGIHILGFIPFAILAWLTLHRIRGLYERKTISDQTLSIDSVWLTFGLANSIDFAFEGAWWILSGLFAFLVFKLSSGACFALLRKLRADTQPYRKLLLLRVFSLGKRSQVLYDTLAKSWRTVGSIQLIARPDLATSTVATPRIPGLPQRQNGPPIYRFPANTGAENLPNGSEAGRGQPAWG